MKGGSLPIINLAESGFTDKIYSKKAETLLSQNG